jgi:putative Mn2+ efflux pump MntP
MKLIYKKLTIIAIFFGAALIMALIGTYIKSVASTTDKPIAMFFQMILPAILIVIGIIVAVLTKKDKKKDDDDDT